LHSGAADVHVRDDVDASQVFALVGEPPSTADEDVRGPTEFIAL